MAGAYLAGGGSASARGEQLPAIAAIPPAQRSDGVMIGRDGGVEQDAGGGEVRCRLQLLMQLVGTATVASAMPMGV